MAEYSDDSSVSGSDEEIESVLKEVPKAEVVVKTKRTYTKKPMTDEQKKELVERLQKARQAKANNQATKNQKSAQETAELKELLALKVAGKLKIKKEKEKAPKREKVIKEIHHYHNAPVVENKVVKPKKVEPPPVKKMIFA